MFVLFLFTGEVGLGEKKRKLEFFKVALEYREKEKENMLNPMRIT